LAGGIAAALLLCLIAANVKVEPFTLLRLFFKSLCFYQGMLRSAGFFMPFIA
jgi:hypothetical protein